MIPATLTGYFRGRKAQEGIILVADAGPVLSRARAQQLDLLCDVVGTPWIPEAVYDDIPRVKSILDALIAAGTYVGEPLYQSILRRVEEE